MSIPYAGRISRVLSTAALENLGMPEEDAAAIGRVIGIGVTVATFDWASAAGHLRDLADFAAQGDWHP